MHRLPAVHYYLTKMCFQLIINKDEIYSFNERFSFRFVMKLIKKAVLISLCMIMLLSLTACGSETKTIKEANMKMELSKQYKKGSLENATWYYTSPDGVAMGVKTSQNDLEKTGLEANSIQDYAEAYTRVNIGTNKTVKQKNGYCYVKYNKVISGTDFSYINFFFDDNAGSYWVISFACYKEIYNEEESSFFASADSVEFINE